MSRSLKAVSTLVSKAIKTSNMRPFSAAAPQGVVSGTAKASTTTVTMVKKTGEEMARDRTEKVSWVPDPRTGFYRPENVDEEIDVAELRATLLKKH